jgi:DNA-binding beta-propeller fold protein YncE
MVERMTSVSMPRTSRRLAIVGLLLALGFVGAATASGFGFETQWGGPPGTAAGALRGPDNLAVDLRGDVYVADRDNNRIDRFTSNGMFLSTIGRNAGDGTPGGGNGEFNHPRGVATDGWGNLYVADSANNRIQKFDSQGRFLTRFGRNLGDGSAGSARGEFRDPRGLATDLAGNLYVADHGNNRVQKLTASGSFLQVWGRNGGDTSSGRGPGEFRHPRGVAVDRAGQLFVADKDNNRIQKFSPRGDFMGSWGRNLGDGSPGSGSGQFRIPYSVAVDPVGHIYVADTGNNRIQELRSDGAFISRFGHNGGDGSPGAAPGDFRTPYGVASDCRGDVYVSDEGNNRIETFGDSALRSTACPPTLALNRLPRRIPGHTLTIKVSCDQPCQATAVGLLTVQGQTFGRFTSVRRTVLPTRSVIFKLRLSGSVAGRLHRLLRTGRHPRATVSVRATGFGGRSRPVQRNHSIGR